MRGTCRRRGGRTGPGRRWRAPGSGTFPDRSRHTPPRNLRGTHKQSRAAAVLNGGGTCGYVLTRQDVFRTRPSYLWRKSMGNRLKRSALLLAAVSALGVLAVGVASAKPTEATGVGATNATLNIYGLGGRDDVAQGRLDIANGVIRGLGHSVNNPVSGFNDQAFLARLAARDIPDLVHMGRDSVGTYAARGVLVPLSSCFQREGIATADYRKAALDQVRYKGQIYGAPEFTNQITIVVNNDALRKAGVNAADIQTTNWKRLKAANKKLLQVSGGRLTRIGFDPKIPEFFPLWVKWFGKDMISKDGLKAQLNSKEAVAALAYAVGLINDHGGWNRFKAFRDTFDYFGAVNPMSANQMGATPFESFWYNVLAEGRPVNITAKFWLNQKGGPLTMLSGNAWAIPRGSKNPGLACKYI